MTKYRFLFITTHNPFNPVGGALQRTRLLFDSLRELGHVDLVCFTGDQVPEQRQGMNYLIQYFGKGKYHDFSFKRHLINLLRIWSPYSLFAKDPVCVEVVQSLLRKYDYTSIVSRYVEPVFLCSLFYKKDIVIDVDDALEELYHSYFVNKDYVFTKRLYYFVRFLLVKYYSQQLYARARHLFFSNASHVKHSNASHLPNIPYRGNVQPADAPPHPGKQHVLFVGTLSYPPNYLGMDLFIRKCWEHVYRKFPEARLRVVGKGIPVAYERRWKGVGGIDIRGFVDDLSLEYADSNLVIAPIYHGSGTNIKLLEAMHANRSCVVSTFAAQGFAGTLVHQHNVMIARSYDEFTGYVIELLENETLNNFIREQAAETIKKHYSMGIFEELLKKGMEQ